MTGRQILNACPLCLLVTLTRSLTVQPVRAPTSAERVESYYSNYITENCSTWLFNMESFYCPCRERDTYRHSQNTNTHTKTHNVPAHKHKFHLSWSNCWGGDLFGVIYMLPRRAEQLKLALLPTDPRNISYNRANCVFEGPGQCGALKWYT